MTEKYLPIQSKNVPKRQMTESFHALSTNNQNV